MTTTVQAPPPAAVPTGTGTAGPPDGPRSRRWLLGFWAAVFVLFLAVQPGRQTFDTKLGVTVDPGRFLADLGQLWHDQNNFGGIQDQYVGYLWPMLPYYWLADLVQLPVWLAERLWLSLIVAVAFWGALRLAERLRIGSGPTRLLAAAAYALWPLFTTVVGSTSAAALPGAFLPWVLLPLADERYSARVAALRSALLVPFMGGVNAASTLASLLPVGLYLLTRPPGPRMRRLIAWWAPAVIVVTAWWWIPLLLLGAYGENFLPFIETAETTTSTMSATEALRGGGNWVAYLHFGEAWLPAGWTVVSSVLVVVCSALAAGLGLAGLARRDLPERRWLVLTVLVAALVLLAGYGGAFGAPFHGTVQDWLDGRLAPFRNIYKFQTGPALALVLGMAHVVSVAAAARGAAGSPRGNGGRARPVRGTGGGPRAARGRRFVPPAAAVLILPGLLWPYLNGSILSPGSFQKIPTYWQATADWLEKYSPDSRALVVPATAHGLYTWGSPIDQPLDVVAGSRWAQRDYVPFGTPGNRRAMDAVEQSLMTGAAVPGLADYLSRAGIFYVVVRNDLDPDRIGHVPTATVKRTLEQSGYERVTGLGPVTTGGVIAEDTPLQVEGLYPRQRAVEVYRPAGQDVPRPGQAGLAPVADTAVVSGGPEALLPLAQQLRGRPTVLTGDRHPGLGTPEVQITGDGLRRADTRFGLVNANTSYTYTRDERNAPDAVQNPGEKPHQILPVEGLDHQTVAELRGARSVTASSYGNWLFHLPQYDPVNAFDGDPATAWAEGVPGPADGQWLRIGFDGSYDMPDSFEVTPLPQDGVRAAATRVRVATEQGERTSYLRADGTTQTVRAPEGATDWMRLTIVGSTARKAGLTGAGFSEIGLPDIQVTRLLRLPVDAAESDARAEIVSLHRAADPTGLSPAGTEAGLHRRFTTAADGTFEVRASAVPVTGAELDRLLYEVAPEQPGRITATAGSTARLGAGLDARNLTDGDLTTAWIAGDRPTIHLSWEGKVPVEELVLAAAGGLSTRPTEVHISSPDGAAIAGVDKNGLVRFGPITTDRLDITITETAPLTLHNPVVDEKLQLPVGLTEAYLPALEQHRTPRPDAGREFTLPCGKGPDVALDGELYQTGVRGTVGDLTERRPVEVTLCQEGRADTEVQLAAGEHRLEGGDAGPLALTGVTLTRGSVTGTSAGRELEILDWLGDRREVGVGSGPAAYFTTYENYNEGWTATLNGRELTPVRLDGWQQGWRIPEGAGGSVKLSYAPATTYDAGLIGAGAGIAAVLGLALWRRREPNPDAPQPPAPPPGRWLGTVALTLVGVVIAGWLALLVPALAVLAWRRPALLAPVAFTALAAAGVAAATGAGDPAPAGAGPFGHTAQLLALLALFAALVTWGGGEDAAAAPAAPGAHPRADGSPQAAGPPEAPGSPPGAGPSAAGGLPPAEGPSPATAHPTEKTPSAGTFRRAGDFPPAGRFQAAGDFPPAGRFQAAGDFPPAESPSPATAHPTEETPSAGTFRTARDLPPAGTFQAAGDFPPAGEFAPAGSAGGARWAPPPGREGGPPAGAVRPEAATRPLPRAGGQEKGRRP
ncbi:alpha-(1-_3)-arabinofuranosyltransferase domain-containing protein [Streptomyces poriticola]|uniref:alpha-(1->3)-arabinofuranosyltransferase domain-containing protein n=1 Tax=Streptomyces poriticola TaxID=3120506 RepID=UPI002FCE035B